MLSNLIFYFGNKNNSLFIKSLQIASVGTIDTFFIIVQKSLHFYT